MDAPAAGDLTQCAGPRGACTGQNFKVGGEARSPDAVYNEHTRSLSPEHHMSDFITAQDIINLSKCRRIVYLDRHGDPALRVEPSEYELWLMEQGIEFEDRKSTRLNSSHVKISY